MLAGAGAQHGQAVGQHHQIANAVRRQLKTGGSGGAVQHFFHFGDGIQCCNYGLLGCAGFQIHRGVGPQRAVVHHIGVGNGQQHAGAFMAQSLVQRILQECHLRAAQRIGLGVHAVVGGDTDHRTHGVQLAQVAIHHGVEGIGIGRARRVLVLHIVGGGQIHQIRPLAAHQHHASGKHEFRQVGAIDRRQRQAHLRQHIGDAVRFQAGLVCMLCRKADAFELVAQQGAQLVLGGYHGHFQALPGHGGQHRGGAQIAGIVHQHFGVLLGVVEVVAANAMHAGWCAGDDGQVVGVGEGGHHAVAREHCAFGLQAFEEGGHAGLHGLVDVFLLAAVNADDHDRGPGQLVAALVDVDVCHALQLRQCAL